MQLMVLGMHRSGTSVLARMLNLMGAYFGPEGASTGANPENPKGFWERRDVRDLNDLVLWSAGCDWDRVLKFDLGAVPAEALAEFNRRAGRLLLDLDSHRPWFMKEPRLCMLFPLWRQFLEVPVCIHIVRHPVEVAASLRSRNKIPIKVGLALWERYVRAALQASAGLPEVVVSHRQLIEDPRGAVERLFVDLEKAAVPGLRVPTDREVDAFVRAELYREREGRADLTEYADASQVRLFRDLLGTKDLASVRSGRFSEEAGTTLALYESNLPPLQVPAKPKPPMPEPERVLREQLSVKTHEATLLRKQAEKAAQEVERKGGELAALERDLGEVRQEKARLVLDLNERDQRLARLEAELCASQQIATDLSADLARSEQGSTVLRQRVDSLASEARQADAARLALEAEISARFGEIETLTRLLMEQEKRVRERDILLAEREAALVSAEGRHVAERQRLQRQVSMDSEKCEVLQKQLGLRTLYAANLAQRVDALSHQLHATYADVGWRATALLRKLRRSSGSRMPLAGGSEDEVEAIRQSGLFDEQWYLVSYPDVAESGISPIMHYLTNGVFEGRNPGPQFDTGYYLSRNMDVAASGMNPLLHYVRYGKRESRKAVEGKNGNG